ncbi:response regulator transcription factor [Massilia sp. IC2-278]|uniref:response regulator n=1 Tax=Massilia sp. IC2-278 TaxID=2887200 RepID=UPI001E650E10|nr:response regulator transcription factor [Massilia sp. IC2-278]MCC2963069.1 response regulator transcription factor [Massilia sp. IC2-278]
MTTVFIADPNDTLRAGIRAILDRSDKYKVVGEASSRFQLLNALKNCRADVLLLEPKMGGATGETLIRQIAELAASTIILGISDLDEKKYGVRVLRAGLKGFLRKDCEKDELLSAIEQVSTGHLHISMALAERLVAALSPFERVLPHHRLSERELDVFYRLLHGDKINQIARDLLLSPKTISTHKVRVFQKIGVSNLSELIRYALAHGIT